MSGRGSASLAMLGIVLLLVVLGGLVVDVGRFLAVRASTVAAADAAALAAAPLTFRTAGSSPSTEAARFATLNGARLVSCRCPLNPALVQREVEVVVEAELEMLLLGTTQLRASSRAEYEPVPLAFGPSREASAPRRQR